MQQNLTEVHREPRSLSCARQ